MSPRSTIRPPASLMIYNDGQAFMAPDGDIRAQVVVIRSFLIGAGGFPFLDCVRREQVLLMLALLVGVGCIIYCGQQAKTESLG